ncbi:hypothetical protein B0H34DRAFT_711194 [Crassisporium funariophilum]|nr:hypothetical protein B0H34DRAFT_711194 [Crassisporium funariophilum]
MFKFDFEIDDPDSSLGKEPISPQKQTLNGQVSTPELMPFAEILIDKLLDELPPLISYSPLHIPLSSTRQSITLVRRDLFDARFQLISEGAGDAAETTLDNSNAAVSSAESESNKIALHFLDAPSDLVPGVYEGGLKTWECSLDLVDYLDSSKDTVNDEGFRGKAMLELGCGTGVPTLYILREIFSSIAPRTAVNETSSPTRIHLQDYNSSVLQLVTLPNILLTWYTSPSSDTYRASMNDPEIAPILDLSTPGELPITAELKSAFLTSIRALDLSLRFFSGSWNTFKPDETIGIDGYNLLLTSETIYRTESLGPLLDLMQTACSRDRHIHLDELISSQLSIDPQSSGVPLVKPSAHSCLVAAKVLYFGVGGGISDFLKSVEERKGRVETVLERNVGVGRKVMSVHWP